MNKKIIVAIIMTMALTSCSIIDKDSRKLSESNKSSIEYNNDSKNVDKKANDLSSQSNGSVKKLKENINFKDFSIKINSIEKIKDLQGKDSYIVNFDIKNLRDNAITPLELISLELKEGDVSLSSTMVKDQDDDITSNTMQPKKELKGCSVGFLKEKDSKLTLNIRSLKAIEENSKDKDKSFTIEVNIK